MSCEFHLSRSELRELIESTGKLLQLPLSSQGGRSIPNRLFGFEDWAAAVSCPSQRSIGRAQFARFIYNLSRIHALSSYHLAIRTILQIRSSSVRWTRYAPFPTSMARLPNAYIIHCVLPMGATRQVFRIWLIPDGFRSNALRPAKANTNRPNSRSRRQSCQRLIKRR